MGIKITVVLPEKGEQVYELPQNKVVIGCSSKCDAQVQDENLSRKHFEISIDGTNFFIKDLGSINGTFINNEKIPANQNIPYSTFLPLVAGKLTFTIEPTDGTSTATAFDRHMTSGPKLALKPIKIPSNATVTKTKALPLKKSKDDDGYASSKFNKILIIAALLIAGIVIFFESSKKGEVVSPTVQADVKVNPIHPPPAKSKLETAWTTCNCELEKYYCNRFELLPNLKECAKVDTPYFFAFINISHLNSFPPHKANEEYLEKGLISKLIFKYPALFLLPNNGYDFIQAALIKNGNIYKVYQINIRDLLKMKPFEIEHEIYLFWEKKDPIFSPKLDALFKKIDV